MQDVPQNDRPPTRRLRGKQCRRTRFAGLTSISTRCALARESGEAIRSPGASSDFCASSSAVRPRLESGRHLEAVANRLLELFDRSVDALVVRWRRRIEPDPKRRASRHRPGEGYRSDASRWLGRASQQRGGIYRAVRPTAAETEAVPTCRSPPSGQRVARLRRHTACACEMRRLLAAAGLVARCSPPALRLAIGLARRFMGTGPEQACKCAASLRRRAAVREPERRQGAGLFRRRYH